MKVHSITQFIFALAIFVGGTIQGATSPVCSGLEVKASNHRNSQLSEEDLFLLESRVLLTSKANRELRNLSSQQRSQLQREILDIFKNPDSISEFVLKGSKLFGRPIFRLAFGRSPEMRAIYVYNKSGQFVLIQIETRERIDYDDRPIKSRADAALAEFRSLF